MHRKALWTAMMSAGLLAACGGGGGDATPATSTPTNPNTANVSLSGVAAKGLMRGALVTAHAVKADGSIDDTPLAPAVETDAEGKYTLSFKATKDLPYVIRVAAKADGSTTHLDEATGAAQPLPAGFTMRSLFVPTTSGDVSTSASVTPFSEMAVAAAAKASGGVTAGNAAQAVSTVTQLLGFDPTKVAVKAPGAADAGTDEKKLAVMLAAVSKMASSGALGCTDTDPGKNTRCIVEGITLAASADSIKLESGSGEAALDVSAALNGAVQAVLADDKLSGGVDPALLTSVVGNLGCSGDTCAPVTTAQTSAIASAKALFTAIKSDWKSLFSRDGVTASSTGPVNSELWKFQQAMTAVQVPAEALLKDVAAVISCIDLYNDYKAGRVTDTNNGVAFLTPSRSAAFGRVDTDGSVANFPATGCSLFQDAAATIAATAPENANYIGVSANYFITRRFDDAGNYTTRWRHGFTLTPAGNGSFTYGTRARHSVTTCLVGATTCSQTLNESIQKNADGTDRPAFTGTVTTTMTGTSVTGFTFKGDLAAAFTRGATTLANDHHTVDLAGNRSVAADGTEAITLSPGTAVAYKSATEVDGTLTLKSGSATAVPVSFDAAGRRVNPTSPAAVAPAGKQPAALSLNLVWTTPTAEFEGKLGATDPVWDKNQTNAAPSKLVLEGSLRTIAAGTATEILGGSFNLNSTGYAQYDSTTGDNANNFFNLSASFVGRFSAPGRPVLELTLGGTKKSNSGDMTSMSMQYRSLVNGAPRQVVNVATSRNASGLWDFTLSEAASGLSMTWPNGADRADLVQGTTKVGTLVRSTRLLTFMDNSFMSVELGL